MIEKIWVEKYRPKKIKGLIGNEKLKEKLISFIEKGSVPNIMLYGPPGTGKTTIAKILINELECEYLYINGSDENNVETVRSKIGNFASSVSFSNMNIVFIDEFDYFTLNAQAILRNLIEAFSDNTRFIVTCNYPKKIMDALQSRFQSYQIKPNDLDQIIKRLKLILEKEEVEYDIKDVEDIAKTCFPDMRKAIGTIEGLSFNKKLVVNESEILSEEYKDKMIEMIKENKKFEDIRSLIINSPNIDYSLAFKMLFDNVEKYCREKKNISLILIDIAEHMYRDAFVVDKEINFSACILKILKHNNG
jgi:DNA polymerase III delta prime subunit